MAIWETPEVLTPQQQLKPELAIGIIYAGDVTMEWAFGFRLLNVGNLPHTYLFNTNLPYDCARQHITKNAIAMGVKWLFFLDSDVVLLDKSGILKMIELSKTHNLPVISGLYWAKKRDEKPMPAAWNKVMVDEEKKTMGYAPIDLSEYLDKNALVACDVCGAGCLLIDTDIFKKLEEKDPTKPFFEWGLTRNKPDGTPMLQISEDFYFCERLNEINVKPHISTLVKCDHITQTKRIGTDGKLQLLDLP